jgi:hypothetical protein
MRHARNIRFRARRWRPEGPCTGTSIGPLRTWPLPAFTRFANDSDAPARTPARRCFDHVLAECSQ